MEPLVDTTELLVSELVTNALRYGEGEIRLRLLLDRTLVGQVWDSGLVQPRRRRARDTDEGGRGLQLVGLLSAAWARGVRRAARRSGSTAPAGRPVLGAGLGGGAAQPLVTAAGHGRYGGGPRPVRRWALTAAGPPSAGPRHEGELLPPAPDLVAEPDQRIVLTVHRPLLQRDQRIVGDLDLLGADLSYSTW
ncbi:hypothetical protein SANTM175S_00211 [Streptomyces antimycoticus]